MLTRLKNLVPGVGLVACLLTGRLVLAQEVRVLDTDPVLARITSASMTAGTLNYTVENVSTTRFERFAASLFVYSAEGAARAGASWCGAVDLGPGARLDFVKEVPFSANPDDRAVVMLTSVVGDRKRWALDSVSAWSAAKLDIMGRKSYLPLRVQAQEGASPLANACDPGWCTQCRQDALASCGPGNIKSYTCSVGQTCTCTFTCGCAGNNCK